MTRVLAFVWRGVLAFDLIGLMRDSPDGVVLSQGRAIDEITEDQRKYYGLGAGDFPEPSADGRVLVLLSTP